MPSTTSEIVSHGRLSRYGDRQPDGDTAFEGIYEAKVKTFADLHNVDWRAAGLEGFGKEGDYVARQIHRWTKQYVASETKKIPEMDALIDEFNAGTGLLEEQE